MSFNRRLFMKSALATAFSGATLSTLAPSLGQFQAHAANSTGYKALVCIFMFGGLDTHDVLIPYDPASYDAYGQIRQPLIARYSGAQGGNSRLRERLLPLAPENAGDFGGRQFALPEELTGIHSLFQSGRAAVVANVGPLVEPLTRTTYNDRSGARPAQLFSHNDQQSTWMASEPEGAQYGWGGRFADAILNSGSNQVPEFSAISTQGNQVFLTGERVLPFPVSLEGAGRFEIFETFRDNPFGQDGNRTYERMRAHFNSSANRSNLIERDMAAALSGALEKNEAFNSALLNAPALQTQFPGTRFAQQLQAVAQTIATRNTLLMNRQVFFVAQGGFDTHSNQANGLPNQMREIDEAVMAFLSALEEMGAANDVTLFTASDFGRTLAINDDGTDHGWGSHHFVIGNAVRGNRIYGDVPPPVFEHDYDSGNGRLIPSMSVEQYAGAMGRWFGLNDTELLTALPGLAAFDSGTSDMAFI
ncbi:MAG: DUF1501 domain-containing protein [Hyphomonadaceae bacterium]|nr:DUF1501 domain-containing protein [Hyphomonadaceae bacterium]